MTSITEGLPMVLLEAMSYGIPSIAYRTESGVADIIDNGENGYIIENRNQKDYIEKLNELITDDSLLKKFSMSALRKSKNFSKDKIIKIWENVLTNEK